jgi:hypothetical protein
MDYVEDGYTPATPPGDDWLTIKVRLAPPIPVECPQKPFTPLLTIEEIKKSKAWTDLRTADITLNIKDMPPENFLCEHLRERGSRWCPTGNCYFMTYDVHNVIRPAIKNKRSCTVPQEWKTTRLVFKADAWDEITDNAWGRGVREVYYIAELQSEVSAGEGS